MKRCKEVSLRAPEPTSAARAKGFKQTVVVKFFDNLEKVMEEKHFKPQNIYKERKEPKSQMFSSK